MKSSHPRRLRLRLELVDNGVFESSRVDSVLERLARLSPLQRVEFERCLRTRRVRGHDLVAQGLKAQGITHVYAMAGLPTDETIGCCAAAGLRTIGVRHQQAAVMAAAAHNYLAGRLISVALVSSGVAVTNAITGVCVAQDNGWPVLLLAGAAERAAEGMGAFMALDGVRVLAGLAKACFRVARPELVEQVLAAASREASEGRPGAVYVELPQDCLEATVALASVRTEDPRPVVVEAHCNLALVEQAAELLMRAKRPAVVFGNGVRWNDAYLVLRELVERLGVPFVASPMGRGLLPDDHPLACTAQQSRVLAEADVVLVVGARLNWTFRYGAELRRDARIMQIDCAPEAFREGPPRALEMLGAAATILPVLLTQVRALQAGAGGSERRQWLASLHQAVAEQPARCSSAALPTPSQLAAALAVALPRDAITILDGNVTLLAAQRHISALTPLSRLTPGTNGCMGIGLPFAMGAALACPERPVVVVTGDMALSMNFFEFETVVRHRVPFVVVLANNDGPCGARRQHKAFPADCAERVLVYQAGIRYDEMARQLGVHAENIAELAELPAALARAFAADRPALVQIQIDPLAG